MAFTTSQVSSWTSSMSVFISAWIEWPVKFDSQQDERHKIIKAPEESKSCSNLQATGWILPGNRHRKQLNHSSQLYQNTETGMHPEVGFTAVQRRKTSPLSEMCCWSWVRDDTSTRGPSNSQQQQQQEHNQKHCPQTKPQTCTINPFCTSTQQEQFAIFHS